MSQDLVSVIIPMYNAEKYIGEAIESALGQTHRAVEVIVVDDGSADKGAEVVARYEGVRCIRQDNAGIGAARNRALAEAKGDYVAFLDADDYWSADKLEMQLRVLREQPDVQLVFGQVRQFLSPELQPSGDGATPKPDEIKAGMIPSALLVSREDFDKVGLFSDHRTAEFADWFARAREAGFRHAMPAEVVAHRRVHETNNTIRRRDEVSTYVRILKASIDRRRAKQRERDAEAQSDES